MGSGCGSVGRAIASDSRGPLFVSSHQHDLYRAITVNFIEKTKIKRKEAGNGPFLKSSWQYVLNRPNKWNVFTVKQLLDELCKVQFYNTCRFYQIDLEWVYEFSLCMKRKTDSSSSSPCPYYSWEDALKKSSSRLFNYCWLFVVESVIGTHVVKAGGRITY